MNVNKKHFQVANQTSMTADNTIVIIGPAEDGPSGIPITIDPNLNPVDVLGYSPLADAYTAVRDAGAKQIVLYRINGSYASATLRYISEEKSFDIIKLTSVSANDKYNNIIVTVYPDYIYIDEREIGGSTRYYFFEEYSTVYDLTYAINRDAYYGLISFTAEALEDELPLNQIVTGETVVYFTGGETEEQFLTRRTEGNDYSYLAELMKGRLEEALFGYDKDNQLDRIPNSTLGILQFAVALVAGAYHDEDPEITRMLGAFCMNKTKHSEAGCIGVIGTSPLFGTEVKERVTELVSIAQANEDTEEMHYVQVVVGDAYYSSMMENIPTSYGYAGTQSAYFYHMMMTNKQILGFGHLNYQISKEDIDLLSRNGYTCIVPSIRRGFVPYLASTFIKNKKSPMSKPHCVRITQYVSRKLSEQYHYLIGSASNSITQREMIDVAEELLEEMVDKNIIRYYTVKCDFTPPNREAKVDISITPFSEITAVNTSTIVALPREVF